MNLHTRLMPDRGLGDYERDFAAWAFDQARRLRLLKTHEIDYENIAEEIESLGKSEVRKLVSLLRIVILHLLKWDLQPVFRSRSWSDSIREHQRRLDEHLAENPSLKAQLDELIEQAFRRAKYEAVQETGLTDRMFPATNPYDQTAIFERECRHGDPE